MSLATFTKATKNHVDLTPFFPDVHERQRYLDALRRHCMRTVAITSLARHAGLETREASVRAALRADPRFERLPAPGPERYVMLPAHRHAARLRQAAPVLTRISMTTSENLGTA